MDIHPEFLFASTNSANHTYVRRAAWWFAHRMLGVTLASIAKRFNKDHSTIMNGIAVFHDEIAIDANAREDLQNIQQSYIHLVLEEEVAYVN